MRGGAFYLLLGTCDLLLATFHLGFLLFDVLDRLRERRDERRRVRQVRSVSWNSETSTPSLSTSIKR
jgi:hypothetical protein